MNASRITLAGFSPVLDGLSWHTDDKLRIGRQANVDIILQDATVARTHAEVRKSNTGWSLFDLANSDSTPSFVNGEQLRGREMRLNLHDVMQFGRMKLKVAEITLPRNTPVVYPDSLAQSVPHHPGNIKTTAGLIRIAAKTQRSWDESLQTVLADPEQQHRQSEHLLTLLRTGHHLRHIATPDELLHSVLRDAIRALGAQRGAIVLADRNGELRLRAMLAPGLPAKIAGLGYSRTLARRCFSQGESMLCQDATTEKALLNAASVRRCAMMSILCTVLRSPRHKIGILHLDRGPFQEPFTEYDLYMADAMAASAAVGIECALLVERQREEFIESVVSLARTVEMRDQYTGDHTRRVTDYSIMLAQELGLQPGEIYNIEVGTPLHDIGKIGVDDSILRKPGRLDDREFEKMKAHTIKGATILQSMKSLDPMIPIVKHHHERWDGSGYPDGLSFNGIPQIARVVAVADAFDAMTSNRPYRDALPSDIAFSELRDNAGSHFDPECVEAFLRIRPLIESRLTNSPYLVASGEK